MTDQDSNLAIDLTPEEREALVARTDEFREIEAQFDAVMRDAERQLQKAEADADKAIKNGASEAEAMNMYRETGNAIKAGVQQRITVLEDRYKQKYSAANG